MALDAAIHVQDSFGYFFKEFYTLGGGGANGGGANGGWGYGYGFGLQEEKGFVEMLDSGMDHNLHGNWESSSSSVVMQNVKEWDPNSSPEACTADQLLLEGGSPAMEEPPESASTPAAGKRKRRRARTCKNKEELENQRMTHIAVERNRRKQMNDYLAVIRSMMPPSYVQRGDQASIIGGAINFVKELEQHLQTLEAQRRRNSQQEQENGTSPPLFADFFTFPQYSTRSSSTTLHSNTINSPVTTTTSDHQPQPSRAATDQNPSALADIEVTMAESHANLKILSKRRPRQLLKLVAGLQLLWLTVLHLNVTTTLDQKVLYSISVKLEEGCQLTTIDEIADAVNHLLGRIEEGAV
ncbi:unnamed protein product [Coffea canephora]|uniref:BHLH domain-containing protein n=2 Tax=Coffea TaxID=13442 RepID=A0A068U0I7_COFCA|nr:transcription factor bHLH94-like [Coffea arabica]CDP01118.1 unnamed protein product [Coffea canephora]